MATRLEALISVNDGEPVLAVGSCCRTMMQNAGLDPVNFRENGNIITRWEWVRCHDGLKHVQIPTEKSKGKKLGSKTIDKLEKRMAAWNS